MILKSKSKRIRIALITKGLTIVGLAGETGHNSSYINQIVNGKRSPSPTLAKKISEVLGVEISDIFEVKEIVKEG